MKIQMIGVRFGRLLVVSPASDRIRPSGKSSRYWLCRCDCGVEKEIAGAHLRNGATVSCGCHKNKLTSLRAIARNTTHGLSKNRLHHVWWSMLQRCQNPSHKSWKWYGGKGITVCDSWQTFDGFISDMGFPKDGMTLDRIDGSKGYTKENCRWATMKTQQNNRSNNHKVTIDGITKNLCQWAEESGVNYDTISYRERSGESGKALLRAPKSRI